MKIPNQTILNKTGDNLYLKYGKPLEDKHWGEYIAISSEGKWLLGTDLMEVIDKATSTFGPGNFVFKIGEKAVWRWR